MTKEIITIEGTQIPINMLKNDSHVLVFNALLGASYTHQILDSLALGVTLGPSAHIYLFNSPEHESQVYILGAGTDLYAAYMFNEHWGIQGGVGATLALYGKTVGDGQLQSGGNPATIPTVLRTHVNAVWNW